MKVATTRAERRRAVRQGFQQRQQLVQKAFRKVPHLLAEPGWQTFWAATKTIPASDLPGFLATHRQFIGIARHSLNHQGEELKRFPAPINTPKGFTAMSAFLHLAKWEEWQNMLERTRADLPTFEATADAAFVSVMRRTMEDAEEAVMHPRIMDSSADILRHTERSGSFAASLEAFQALATARSGDSAYDFVFEHPSFIWIEKRGGDEALLRDYDPKKYGKWVCWLANLGEAVDLAKRLLPAFQSGELACTKFLVTTTSLGGIYFLTYSPEEQEGRREVLDAASGQPSFFVYDADCHEADGLGRALQGLVNQLSPADVEVAEANVRTYLPRLAEPTFGKAQGISDVQRRVMLAVLNMNPAATPIDRFNYLALTYFDKWRPTLGAMLPKMLDPQNTLGFRLSIEAMRAATKSGPFMS